MYVHIEYATLITGVFLQELINQVRKTDHLTPNVETWLMGNISPIRFEMLG